MAVVASAAALEPGRMKQSQHALVPALYPMCNDATDLHKAAEAGQVDMVRSLLAAGLDPGATDQQGYTPLMYALRTFEEIIVGEKITMERS
jgi:ankyrin repeat protein